MPDKPFFMYFAPGATHAPHHVPEEWAEKYRGDLVQIDLGDDNHDHLIDPDEVIRIAMASQAVDAAADSIRHVHQVVMESK